MHQNKLRNILFLLDNLVDLNDLNSPRLHPLKGDLKGLWAVTVQANWRITFEFDEKTSNVYVVD